MENKSFYAANGRVYNLESEKNGFFYKRVYCSPKGATVTERGCSFGCIKTFRTSNGQLRKIDVTTSFSLFWATLPFKFAWFLVLFIFQFVLWEFLKWLWVKAKKIGTWVRTHIPLIFSLSVYAILTFIYFCPDPYSLEPVVIGTDEMMPRETAVGRAYLDGEDNLLGCKFICDKSVQDVLETKENTLATFEEISASVWDAQLNKLLNNEVYFDLSYDRISVITLLAMRNGETAFKASKFLSLINEGNYLEASREIWIFDQNGKARDLDNEGKLYCWCLWALWQGYISFEELWEAPAMGYKNLDADKLYPYGNRFDRDFKPEFKEIVLKSGNNPVVKDMSFFDGNNLTVETLEFPQDSNWNKVCRFVKPAKDWIHNLIPDIF